MVAQWHRDISDYLCNSNCHFPGAPPSGARDYLCADRDCIDLCQFYCLFLFLGSLTLRVPKLRNVVYGVATTLLMAICGVSVPVAFWPSWVRSIAEVLPVTHGLQSVRLLLGHGAGIDVLHGVVFEAFIAVLWLCLAVWSMDRMADAGRANGSIEFV